jgi:hypothetical protein
MIWVRRILLLLPFVIGAVLKFTSRFGSVFCNMNLKLETGNGNLHG